MCRLAVGAMDSPCLTVHVIHNGRLAKGAVDQASPRRRCNGLAMPRRECDRHALASPCVL